MSSSVSADTLTADPPSNARGIVVRPVAIGNPSQVATYSCGVTAGVSTGTAGGTITSIAYLFHPASSTKKVELIEVVASIAQATVATAGRTRIEANYITAENGTPGGTVEAIQAHETIQAASDCTFRRGAAAPTRVGGCLRSYVFSGNGDELELFLIPIITKPIVFLPSVARGLEIRTIIESVLTTATFIGVSMTWREF